MIVLDASALLELLLATPKAAPIAARALTPEHTLHVPHLIDAEVAQVLRRLQLCGSVGVARADQALSDFADLPLTRHEHTVLLPRVWALRNAMTAYDALYVALSEALPAPLLTCDARLARAHGHGASVELF